MAPIKDYSAIIEHPNAPLTGEQLHRFAHRYELGAELGAGRRILDAACGAGEGLGRLQRAGSSLVGGDYTESALHEIQATYGARIPLACADAQYLPYAAGSFDLVLCFEALNYLEDYTLFLQESRRVLSPGGRLLVCLSNPDWPDFVPGRMSTRYPSGPELAAAVAETGFHSVKMWGILPATAYTPRQLLVNRLRHAALGVFRPLAASPLLEPLKRLAYGRMTPLPAELDAATMESLAAETAMTQLPPDRRDAVHRVFYLYAER